MSLNQVRLKTTEDKIRLVPLGDVHLGSPNCDIKKFKGYVDYVSRTPNTYTILMGDLLNTELADTAGNVYESTMTPQEELELALELLEPLRGKIIGVHNGNHEARIYQRTSLDLSRDIARALGAPYLGDAGFTRVIVEGKRGARQAYDIYSEHGSSSSTTPGSKMNVLMREGSHVIADLLLMGHMHDVLVNSELQYYVDSRNKCLKTHKTTYALTGHFLNWLDSYAQRKGMSVGKTGAPKISLFVNEHDVHASL